MSAEGVKGRTSIVEPTTAERAIARRAAESRATVPHLDCSVAAPAGALSTAMLVHASALALREHPRANAAYRDGRFELYSRVNVGVVAATADAYLIPTVLDADAKPVDQLAEEIEQLSSAAAAGELAAPAFSGATFTVWNAAELGLAAASLPVVPPQAAALTAGTGALTLACDHRILYGARAAAFLGAIASSL